VNINQISKLLFSDFYLYVILAGIIFLIALVGSTVLTLKFDTSFANQNINKQVVRDSNSAIFFIK
jgi:hypothetical protein